jgi:uncharacterized protein YkwD
MMKLSFYAVLFAIPLTACNSTGSASSSDTANSGGSAAGGNYNPPSSLDSEEAAFVVLINNYRVQNGAPALQVSATLTAASQWMSQDMASKNYLDHTDSLGRDPGTRMFAFGYPSDAADWGENIAAGNSDAQSTFTQWQQSAAHNANMLDASYLALGVGRAYNAASDYGWYWTTDFGSTVDSLLQ